MNSIRSIHIKEYIPLVIFAIAMGFLEAIVVVYARELYYPDGFHFPLKIIPEWLIIIELIRELCTLVMIGATAWISGKTFLKRLSVFLFVFGIWDIFYYTSLKIFIDWPDSLLTWDVLFMIPITWVGPVLAPVICSIVMIAFAILLDNFRLKKKIKKLQQKELFILSAGTLIIYFTFTFDFGMIVLTGNFLSGFFSLAENPDFLKILSSWEPTHFNWEIFTLGIAIVFAGIFLIIKRANKKQII